MSPRFQNRIHALPALQRQCAERWALTLLPPFPDLSYNFVQPALRNGGEPVVLKLGLPSPELRAEAEALRVFDGQGAVRLLEEDADQGAMLLKRVTPGDSLLDLTEEDAFRAAAGVMTALPRPYSGPFPFPRASDWLTGLDRARAAADSPLPIALILRAQGLADDLLASAAPEVLIHGDLHHGNVLRSEHNAWVAIDPKGLLAEPAYEAGAMLRNPWGQILTLPDLAARSRRRIAILSEMLGLPAERIAAWGFVQAALSAWWSVEDGGPDWRTPLHVAETLAGIL